MFSILGLISSQSNPAKKAVVGCVSCGLDGALLLEVSVVEGVSLP